MRARLIPVEHSPHLALSLSLVCLIDFASQSWHPFQVPHVALLRLPLWSARQAHQHLKRTL
jgi:hypothetical protein